MFDRAPGKFAWGRRRARLNIDNLAAPNYRPPPNPWEFITLNAVSSFGDRPVSAVLRALI